MALLTERVSRIRSERIVNVLLAAYGLFTGVAVVGYAVFGRNPRILADYPDLLSIYGISFQFFAQAHVYVGALALFAYLTLHAGRRWLFAFATLYVISFLSEFIGTGYGVPFGSYGYNAMLGPKWFGRVPLVIPLSWFTMAVPAYVLAGVRFNKPGEGVYRVGVGTLLLATWDLSLDPAMSFLTSYWWWGEQGVYYGMPLLNLFGWIVTGAVLMGVLHGLGAGKYMDSFSPRWMGGFYAITLAMPLGMVAAGGIWGAVLATAVPLVLVGYVSFRTSGKSQAPPPSQGVSLPAPSSGKSEPVYSMKGIPEVRSFFRRHSKSFSFAARWFPRRERRLIACLYAFCRTTDDIVDKRSGRPRQEVEAELDRWMALSEAAYRGASSGIPWLDEIMTESARVGMPFEVIRDLAVGVRTDLNPVRIQDQAELSLYTYRVASVVGIWLCYLHGIRSRVVLDQAAALGRAMQITNIIRDVGDDWRQNRVYIPADLMQRYRVTEADLERMAAGEPVSPAYANLMEAMIRLAEDQYTLAFPGLADLPRPFGRAAAVASGVYRGIHDAVRRNGYDNFHRRAYTGPWEKLRLAFRALRQGQNARRPAPVAERRIHWLAQISARIFFLLATLLLTYNGSAMEPPTPMDSWPWYTSEDPTARLVEQLRSCYLDAVEDETAIDEGLALVEQFGREDPLSRAYGAALIVLRAKHAFWPHHKMQHLRRGLPVLDALVAEHPDNVEIRYLRLLSGYFLPGFLGRRDEVRADFDTLARLLPAARHSFPPDLYRDMAGFVMSRGALSEKDRRRFVGPPPDHNASVRK